MSYYIGGTIPDDVLSPHALLSGEHRDFKPAICALHRGSGDIYIFEVQLPHEAEMETVHRCTAAKYSQCKDWLQENNRTSHVYFYSIEIGSSLGHMSENTKFAMWQLFQITTKLINMDQMITNVSSLAKLTSYKIFKHRYESRWDRRMRYLSPTDRKSIWSTGISLGRRKGYRRRGLIRGYVVPLLKLLAAIFVVGLGIFAFYLIFIFGLWIWSLMTLKIAAFMGLAFLGFCLQLFRP